MRSTIHLVSARDCLELQAARPGRERARATARRSGSKAAGLDVDAVVREGRAILTEQPLPAAALGRRLQAQWPDYAPDVLANLVRTHVALVQVPPRGLWGKSGASAHTPADIWLGAPLAPEPSLDDMVLRYVAAFGPATVQDAQAWSGLTKLGEVFDRLAPRLVTFRDEDGRTLLRPPRRAATARRCRRAATLPSRLRQPPPVARRPQPRRRRRAPRGVHGQQLRDRHGADRRVGRCDVEGRAVEGQGDDGGGPAGRCGKTTRDAVTAEGERLLKVLAPASVDHDVRVT